MRPEVLLLDVDGTLVDNTAQHIAAWREALSGLGLRVDDDLLRANIGKGGDLFVKAAAGEAWDESHGDEARRRHAEAYQRHLAAVRPVAGVQDFLAGLRALGIRPVLATSSNPEEVEKNLAIIGERPEHFLVVDRDDINTSKPAPDVFAVALQRSKSSPDRAAAVGDTRWDAQAARKNGLRFWGVLTGAGRQEELEAAGAEGVFPDLRSLLDFLREDR